MRRTALSLAAVLTLAASVPFAPPAHEAGELLSRGLGWDIGQTADAWFALNRRDIVTGHDLALRPREEDAGLESELERRNWQIPTAGLPPLPLTYWLVANPLGLPILANAAVRRMQTWYFENTNTYNMTSWWQHPVILNSYIDLDAATKQNTNQRVVRAIIDNNERGSGWMIDQYIDDQAWWGLTLAKAYQQYGVASYLSAAKAIQSSDTDAESDSCGGGPVWLTYKPQTKNTVTSTLHIALSARLYKITGTASYLQTALRNLDWWLGWAYDAKTGSVYDTIVSPGCTPKYRNLYTYNAGIILGGLVDLASTTGNQTYLTLANKIAFNAISVFSNGKGIMRESCEHDGPPNGDDDSGGISASDGAPKDNLPAGCQNDNIMFKAIFAQNIGYLYQATNDTRLLNYLTINALSSAFYNMDRTFLFGEWFDGPFNSTLANVLTQGNALGLLSAATAATLTHQAALAAAKGQPAPSVTGSFTVVLPTGGVSEADTTALKRRWEPARRTGTPSL